MRLSHFFIERPVFAAVIAILITLVGAIAYPNLPIAQYPQIAPPTVTVSATYPGASAETLADAVAAPIDKTPGSNWPLPESLADWLALMGGFSADRFG